MIWNLARSYRRPSLKQNLRMRHDVTLGVTLGLDMVLITCEDQLQSLTPDSICIGLLAPAGLAFWRYKVGFSFDVLALMLFLTLESRGKICPHT